MFFSFFWQDMGQNKPFCGHVNRGLQRKTLRPEPGIDRAGPVRRHVSEIDLDAAPHDPLKPFRQMVFFPGVHLFRQER
jgi:hypothetical protein